MPFYFIVKNSYSKTESFVRNKFRTLADISSRQILDKKPKVNATISFDIGGVKVLFKDQSTTFGSVSSKLLSITFENFMSILSKVFKLDTHIHPQHYH